MGQKVNPIGFRMGGIYTWSSRWFAKKGDFAKFLLEDNQIRKYLMENVRNAGVSKVEIERFFDKRTITVHVSRPGIAIGRGGSGAEQIKSNLLKQLKLKDGGKMEIKFEEIKAPDLDAYLVAVNVSEQLQRRIPFRRVMNQSLERIKRSGAKGAKIALAGRLGGSEIARREVVKDGSIPLQTLRAPIDFAKIDSKVPKAGIVGIKVWIYKGEN